MRTFEVWEAALNRYFFVCRIHFWLMSTGCLDSGRFDERKDLFACSLFLTESNMTKVRHFLTGTGGHAS